MKNNIINQKIIENLENDEEYLLLISYINGLDVEKTYNPLEIIKIQYRKIMVQKRLHEIKKHYFEEIKHQSVINPTYQKIKKPVLQQR